MSSLPDSMQECQVCGLLFGGGDRCPECKSVFGSSVEIDQDENLPSGPLPGTASLTEILSDVEGLSGPSSDPIEPRQNLPFTLGGARTSPKVQLLFGAGARSDLRMDAVDTAEEIQEIFIDEDIIDVEDHVSNSHVEVEEIVSELPSETPQDIDSTNDEEVLLTSRIIPVSEETESSDSDDVVYHDFSDQSNFTEVQVDFDNLVDPAEASSAFDPTDGETRLVQMPARAMPLSSPFQEGEEELMISAFGLMQAGDWQDAANIFMSLCEQRPGDAPAINNHGLCLLQYALSEFILNPSSDPAKHPHFHAAILTLRQAAMADRSSTPILVNLATALAAADRHETALPIFEAAASLETNPDANRMNNHAVTLHAMGRNIDATSMLDGAQSTNPEDVIIAENVRVLTITF